MKKLFTFLFALLATTIALQAQYSEDFENGFADWTITNADDNVGSWMHGTATTINSAYWNPPEHTQFMNVNDDAPGAGNNTSGVLTSNVDVDLTGMANPALNFAAYFINGDYGGDEVASALISTDGGANWAVLYDVPGDNTGWQNISIPLDAYAGMTIRVGFSYDDGNSWNYGFSVDDVAVYNVPFLDVKVDRLTTPRFHMSGSMVDVSVEVSNFGINEINSLDLEWSDGTNTYTETVNGLSIPFGQSAIVTHTTQFDIADAVAYNVTVSASNPNGGAEDGDLSNNMVVGPLNGLSSAPAKKMFVEEATGTWCGWCPRGWEWMDYMAENYPDDFVGIAVHNSDPMEVTEYDDGLTSFPDFTGFPSVIIDRTAIFDPSEIEDVLPASQSILSPVAPSVTATMDVAAMTIDIEGSADFVTQLSDSEYRINLVLAEDSITGTGSGWDQVNYYSGANPDPIPGFGIDWNAAANPVSGSELYYNHVGRWLSDGWGGAEGTTSVVDGETVTYTYSGAFDDSWNPFNMKAVIMVLDNDSERAWNVNSEHVDVVCPADIEETIDVTDTPGGTLEGEINVTLANPNLGFGGYTYSLNSGQTAEVGTPITGLGVGDYTITVVDAIGCSHEFSATVLDANSVQDIDALTSMTLFPNPSSNSSMLNATFNEAVDLKVSVISNIGQVVDAAQYDNVSEINHSIDVSKLPAGLYLVKLNVDDQVRTHRLMVR